MSSGTTNPEEEAARAEALPQADASSLVDAARLETEVKEMYRQVGDLVFDENGLARRGLLVRHLVMPGALEESRQIMRFLASEISPDTYVNVMDQYYPAGRVGREKYSEINRHISVQELRQAYELAREVGLRRFDRRWSTEPGLGQDSLTGAT